MKKILQIFLIIILFLFSFLFYSNYIKPTQLPEKVENNEKILQENKNNLIKNLKYNVKFDDNTEYSISAELSELIYEQSIEMVYMRIVSAELINRENISLTIKSRKAKYNNLSYNTNFSEDVIIEYMDNKIYSDNLDLNFDKNIIKIYNNVVYDGTQGLIKTDNVLMNIKTKEIKIFMDRNKDQVEITTK